ncbi:MAG TPA: hypothetical protein VL947_05005 [Cytophagales bacterium]|nr:hypothetical protein [Cytophagales bacterium]
MKVRKLRFAITGSVGLVLHKPNFGEVYGPIHDCDIFIDKEKQSLALSVQILWDEDWSVSVWGQEVLPPYKYDLLKGKIYLRGYKEGHQVDITYEYDESIAGNVVHDIKVIEGWPVFKEQCILKQKLTRGHAKDLLALEKYLAV